MDKHIVVLFLMGIVAITVVVAFVVIAFYNYRLKNRIIDSGPLDAQATEFLKNVSRSKTESLKWGCIIFSGGLGLVLINYIPYADGSPLPFGIEAMFIAAGFLAYYFIIRRQQQS